MESGRADFIKPRPSLAIRPGTVRSGARRRILSGMSSSGTGENIHCPTALQYAPWQFLRLFANQHWRDVWPADQCCVVIQNNAIRLGRYLVRAAAAGEAHRNRRLIISKLRKIYGHCGLRETFSGS